MDNQASNNQGVDDRDTGKLPLWIRVGDRLELIWEFSVRWGARAVRFAFVAFLCGVAALVVWIIVAGNSPESRETSRRWDRFTYDDGRLESVRFTGEKDLAREIREAIVVKYGLPVDEDGIHVLAQVLENRALVLVRLPGLAKIVNAASDPNAVVAHLKGFLQTHEATAGKHLYVGVRDAEPETGYFAVLGASKFVELNYEDDRLKAYDDDRRTTEGENSDDGEDRRKHRGRVKLRGSKVGLIQTIVGSAARAGSRVETMIELKPLTEFYREVD